MPDLPRAPTETERAVLELLLSVDFPGVAEYRDQARRAVVTERCPCGCLEFSLAVPDDSHPASGRAQVTAWSEEQQVHLDLETRRGRLAGVALTWFGEDDARIAPDLGTFEVAAGPGA